VNFVIDSGLGFELVLGGQIERNSYVLKAQGGFDERN
jgi:hypothetical protein